MGTNKKTNASSPQGNSVYRARVMQPVIVVAILFQLVITDRIPFKPIGRLEFIPGTRILKLLSGVDASAVLPDKASPKSCYCSYYHSDQNLLAFVNGRTSPGEIVIENGKTAYLRCKDPTMNLTWFSGMCAFKSANITCNVCRRLLETDIPACQVNCTDCHCKNGGTCEQGGECICPLPFEGRNCEKKKATCSCQNGGTCEDSGKCLCPPQFYGKNCEKRTAMAPSMIFGVDPRSDPSSFDYHLPSNYASRNSATSKCVTEKCRQRLLTCYNFCQNGGTCELNGKCKCPTGFKGWNCDKKKRKWSFSRRPTKYLPFELTL